MVLGEPRALQLVPKRGSTFHDWPYAGPRRKCFHAWIVNLTPPGKDHCIHDCVYCYARYAIYSRPPKRVMQIYSNLPELVEMDLRRIRLCPPFSISNTTDPCQAVPELRRETRRLVELLVRKGPSFSITTKADPSFLLDIDGFAEFPRKFIAITIEGPPEVLRLLSPGAPPYEARLEALRSMSLNGVKCIVRLDPVLIHLWKALYHEGWRERLEELMRDFQSAGAVHVVSSTGRFSKSRPSPSMFQRLKRIVATLSPRLAEEMERDYVFSREGTSEGYLLRREARLDFHRIARALAEDFGMSYATCQETMASETDSPYLPHCEGICLPFTVKGSDGVFRPVPGCTANCHVTCAGASRAPPCGRRSLVSSGPLRLSALK
ncbi:MAG: hypothetical protein QW379_03235 [Thermoplasmata archaeon]